MNRRHFLKTGAVATGGLVLGFYLPDEVDGAAEPSTPSAKLNAWVHISPDDTVTLSIHKAEMGQGTVTSLSMLLAEELECDWKKIRTEFPGVNPEFGPVQGVVGSQSIRTSWDLLRKTGAAAREMLVQAAAQKWNVDVPQCRAENNAVVNTQTNARLSYGSLAEAASKLPVPAAPMLKDPSKFRLLGKPMKRLDTPLKVNGTAGFALDMKVPGMLYAVVARSAAFGGKVISFDATKAKAVPGVKHVVQISNGVAVVADNTWAAIEGRKALQLQIDDGPRAGTSSATIRTAFMALAEKPGAVGPNTGNVETAMAGAATKLQAVYEVPYLAHSPMEPLNCTAHVQANSCDIWTGSQMQTAAHQAGMRITGLPADKVQIHTTFLGGGFGRRARVDFISEAIETSKAVGVPVKLVWTREDDTQQDFYRPASYTTFAAGLDAQGWPVAWHARVVCPSFSQLRDGVDRTGIEGIAEIYEVPNMRVEYHPPDVGIPVSFWRSVGYSQNTFFTESFIDEMAAAAGKDPLEFRRRLLAKQPRLLGVLNLAAEKIGWNTPPARGRFRGIGLSNNVGSFEAQIAEVSVDKGKVRVHRVVCAVDCGYTVNPATIVHQVRGGIVFGLTAALKGAITIDRGRVEQGNFNNYEMLRIDEMPAIDVHIMPSTARVGGMGECSTPGIAPAVANAIFKATGKRIRQLPIRLTNLA
jgi:isoquinoline 1-oxidoreductase subunit beta